MPDVLVAPARPTKEPRNGVNTPVLLATINAVKDAPELARFRFRASNRWFSGTYNESRVEMFDGAGGEHSHKSQYRYTADHPAVLVGEDRGPTPIEFLLHGLAACITSGIANIAAVRGITLTSVESQVEADAVRNSYQRVRINFTISGDAPRPQLRQIVEQSRRRSAVYDVLTNPTPVHVDVVVGGRRSGESR